MSSAAAFLELRQFLGGLEISSRKLRESLHEKSKVFGVQGDVFVDGLAQTVVGVQSRLNDVETSVSGPPESRLSQVTMLEILQKCKAVHQANDAMLSALTAKLTKRGVWNAGAAAAAAAAAAAEATENQENMAPPVNGSGDVPLVGHMEEDDAVADAVLPHEAVAVPEDSPAVAADNNNDADAAVEIPAAASVVDDAHRRLSTAAPHTPGGVVAERDEEARTPVLPDWKLSAATRNLVGVNNCNNHNNHNNSGPGHHTQRKEPLQRHTVAPAAAPQTTDKHAARSPAPKRAATTATKAAAVSSPVTPSRDMNLSRISVSQSVDRHLRMGAEDADEPEMLTPQPVEKSVHLQQLDNDGTPKTPTLGTPFHTTRLRDAPGARGVTRKLDVDGPAAAGGPKSSARKAVPSRTPEASSRGARGAAPVSGGKGAPAAVPEPPAKAEAAPAPAGALDVSLPALEDTSDLLSPPKMARLAVAKRAAAEAPARVPATSFIAPVTADEYASAPPFLLKQTKIDKVNEAVAALNHFLAQGGASTLSVADMDGLMDKPYALILGNLKRYDVGNENGTKVYKMKK